MLNRLAGIHVVKTVDELLFTGYKDSIIDMGQFAPDDEEIPPYDRFGWFYMVIKISPPRLHNSLFLPSLILIL